MAAAGDDGQRGEHGGAYEILTDATRHGPDNAGISVKASLTLGSRAAQDRVNYVHQA